MPRPSKKAQAEKEAAAAAAAAAAPVPVAAPPPPPVAAPAQQAPRVIDVDNFIRVRDSVYARLSTIQDLIKSFSADYLRQTNLLLGEPTNFIDPGLQLQALDQQLGALGPQFAAAAMTMPEEKKEKKKRAHDPNAPKRPLTPYFLYMQTARPIIANDLGENAPKKSVQEEGQRRWASMGAGEKQGWNQAYQYNLRLYNARVHAYKAGNKDAKSMDDDEANAYANEHDITMPPAHVVEEAIPEEPEAVAELAVAVAEEEPETVATKTPKKPQRKRKTATPAVDDTPASPGKKRKRTSTKPADTETVEPKKSSRRKSAKSS